MANNPRQSKDATEEAISAIQEALSVRENGVSPADDRRRSSPATADLFHDGPPAADWSDENAPVRRPANDDRAAIGKILQTLQRRPGRLPYAAATILSGLWIAAAAVLIIIFKNELLALAGQPDIGIPAVAAAVLAVAIPVTLFYAIAHIIRRTHDLRLVVQTMAEVAMRLAEPETAARESIVNVGQAIRREVAAMGDGVERALARAAELEALVHNEVSALERAYNDNEVRIRDLLAELTTQRDTLVGQAEQVRNAIASVHLDLSHDITSVGDLVAEKVNDVAQRVTRSLTEKGEHITLALGHAGDSMIDTLSERGSGLLQRLETTSDRATTAISSASDRLSASLNFKTDHIHDEFADLSTRLQQMMASRLDQVTQNFAQKSSAVIEQMASRSQQATEALTSTGAQLSESIAARTEEVNNTLRATGDSLVLDLSLRGGAVVSQMEQTGSRITDTIVARSNKVAETFQTNAEALASSIGTHGDGIKDTLNARLQAFEDMFTHSGTELTEKISRGSNTLGNLIIRHMGEFDRTVKVYGGELVERLGARTQDVSEAMKTYVDTFDERVNSRSLEISGTLDQRLSQFERLMGSHVSGLADTLSAGGREVVASIDKRISEAGDTINQRGGEVAASIGAKIEQIDTTLGARATQVAESLDGRIGRFEELLAGRVETVTTQVEVRSKAAADALNARMEELSQSIKVNAGDAERSLAALSANVSGSLKQDAEAVERRLVGVGEEVARSFTGKADEIASAVSRQTADLTNLLSDKSGGVLAALTEKSAQFAQDITTATENAVKSIDERGFTFSHAMMSNSEELARIINVAGETATSAVTRTLNDLQHTTQSAIEQSKQTAAATVSEMLETHGMLRSDSTALFERLREANIMLQEVLSGAHENMSALENTLMLRVSDFVTAMNDVTASTGFATSRVENNIGAFREASARVLTELGQLAVQFDSHGRELARAAEQIDRSNLRTEDAVNERRVALDSLISTLDIRTEDLDQRLKRFSGLLDESLETAGVRAREISRVVSETSVENAHVIADQFERMRSTAEEERRRTSETMRSIYEQSTGESHTLLQQATERFGELMQGMKQMSAEMQRELDATRTEMRKGILELPQETAESAAQMRRVLVDQIEALAELNRIVARHGRNLDATEPVRRPVREDAPLAGSRADAPLRTAARSLEVGSFAPPSPRTEPAAYAPQATRTRTAEAAPANPAQPNNKGWLNDLLTRASRDEGEQPARTPSQAAAREAPRADERTARHSIESLDSLSVDIARMIDHDAAADLWDRYKRGERNVFTRRLYTLQGQKAFDDIRVKYRADREFKQTVDRYIAEFERLLEEVSRDDRGQVVARTYLTSETGKVYTMLAHAAGRFD
ncbi:MAG: hypothetical protein ACR2K5_13025 [Pseudolabrys sp.]